MCAQLPAIAGGPAEHL